MAYSFVQYTGNGSNTIYTVPFNYISTSHVSVFVGGVLTTGYTYLTASSIQFTVAPPNGASILIKRVTPIEQPVVDYVDGSTLGETLLDATVSQNLYAVQEASDSAAGCIVLATDGTLDAQTRIIKNVADPVNPHDVVTKGYADGLVMYGAGNGVMQDLATASDTKGSALVGFKQSGTGAVSRTSQSKLREFVSVADFGIVGNGTDESSKVQAALDYLNSAGGGELRFNGEVVRCDSPLIGYSNTKIIGTPGSTIDWSYRSSPFNTPGDQGLLVFRGTASSEILLTADAVYKTNKITVPNAALFSEGDLVEISMNAEGSFPDTSVGVKSGQLNILTGVYTGTNSLVLDTIIFEPLGYTTTNGARIRKVTPVENIIIEGMTFKGVGRPTTNTSGDQGIRIFFGRNVTVKNCVFNRIDDKSVEVVSCHHFLIDNNEIYHDKIGDTNSNVSYSIAYSSSQYGKISNNKIVNPRHGIVSSHLSSALTNKYYGVSRFIVIDSNQVTGNFGDVSSSGWPVAHAGISTHTDAEFITIVNNTVSGCSDGINPRTFNIIIANNTLEFNKDSGVLLSGVFRDILITGNRIRGSGVSITNTSDTYSNTTRNLTIANNVIENSGSVYFVVSSSTVSQGLDFSGNQMLDYAGGSTIGMIVFNGAFTGKIQNNTIANSTINAIRLENTKGILVSGNHIYECDRPMNVLSTCNKTVITNNTFIGNTNGPSIPANTQSVVSGNNDFGSGAL